MKTDTTTYREIMWAERKVDCYDGPECDCDAGMCCCGFDWKQWAEDRYA